jgi:hypothetical protein
MAAPRQMTANTLNALKGWPSQSALDFHAKFDATILAANEPILAGSVVTLGDDGEFELGCDALSRMPLFLFNNSDDPDVENPGGDPTAGGDAGVWVAVAPTGQAMALVATGAYELTSTAYVAGGNIDVPNTPLWSDDAGGNIGKLDDTTWTGAKTVVGVVSRGVVDNGYGHNSVAFWPYFLPGVINV